VVYVTTNKVWVGEKEYSWDGRDIRSVFEKIKKASKVSNIRVVLGSDVSFVTSVKSGDIPLTRKNILKHIKSLVPFEIDDESFDWKQVVLGYNENWVQIVALRKNLLMNLKTTAEKFGIRIDKLTAIGVLLAEKTKGREAPVIIRWNDREKLLVLAVNGLADIVVSSANRDELMVYASHRWGLAVNPEEILFDGNRFDLEKSIYEEKTGGEDKDTLSLPTRVKETSEKDDEWLDSRSFLVGLSVAVLIICILAVTVFVVLGR